MNSSIHESDSGKKIALNTLTSRSGAGEERSFDGKRNSFTGSEIKKYGGHGLNYSVDMESSGEPMNKKRQ